MDLVKCLDANHGMGFTCGNDNNGSLGRGNALGCFHRSPSLPFFLLFFFAPHLASMARIGSGIVWDLLLVFIHGFYGDIREA